MNSVCNEIKRSLFYVSDDEFNQEIKETKLKELWSESYKDIKERKIRKIYDTYEVSRTTKLKLKK